jgi:predicted small integral membrane protein
MENVDRTKIFLMNRRLIKILFSAAVGIYMSLVCFNNIFDYKSNFPFVSTVASMTDTFSKERNGWRSIDSLALHHVMFVFIIAWELSVVALIITGVTKMARRFRSTADEFRQAKTFVTWGLSLGVLLWFTVFIAIAGEWFLMWQSKTWNAQPTAFFLACCFLLFLIHHNQEDQ